MPVTHAVADGRFNPSHDHARSGSADDNGEPDGAPASHVASHSSRQPFIQVAKPAKPGSQAVRQSGNLAARRWGGQANTQPGSQAARQPSSQEVRAARATWQPWKLQQADKPEQPGSGQLTSHARGCPIRWK